MSMSPIDWFNYSDKSMYMLSSVTHLKYKATQMKYRVLCDGLWYTVEDKPVLTSDIVLVFQEDEEFYYLEVRRFGGWFGNLKVARSVFHKDFEQVFE